MLKKETLIKNEMKHLSKEYRSNHKKMDMLLHADFFEIGESGHTYNKDDILRSMPLENQNFEIKDFSFVLEGDYITTKYRLIRDVTKKSMCEAKWIKTLSGLKLIYFKNSTARD